jgi:hypothetical protein
MALLLFAGSSLTPCNAQAPTPDDTPTFYRLVPGTYVNGYPRFTIHYPKDWVEKRHNLVEAFRAEPPPSAPRSGLWVGVFSNALSLDKFPDIIVPYHRTTATDVTLVSDKPSHLRDGTSAWEVETKMVLNGELIAALDIATKEADM